MASKYHREIKKDVFVDVYDILVAFEVINPAMAHAIKKLLAPGIRGWKDYETDCNEAIASIHRAIELEAVIRDRYERKQIAEYMDENYPSTTRGQQ